MFDPSSRYAGLDDAIVERRDAAGDLRRIRYARRRFLPRSTDANATEIVVCDGDRLDRTAAEVFGDPTEYWRLCDANRVMRPGELDVPGRVVLVEPGDG